MIIPNKAVQALREAVGVQNVIVDPAALAQYETATFATDQRVPLVVLPKNSDEVTRVLEIANQHRTAIYPTSRGRNWGLGSRVPVTNNNCIIDLKRMNTIIEFNPDQSYVVVEPGVTFKQVADFLQERNSDLYLAAIGGPSDSSLIGNAMERGDAMGPMGDRARFCCIQEVILANGQRLCPGPAVFRNAASSKVTPVGVGPAIEELFFQSNFGIVTRMAFWLARKPPVFQSIVFTVDDQDKLLEVSRALSELLQLGIVKPTSCILWNIYRVLAAQGRYPWNDSGGALTSPQALLDRLPKGWKGVRWVGLTGLYSASRAHARADRRVLKKALKGKVSKLIVFDSLTAKIAHFVARPMRKLSGIDIDKMLKSLYYESILVGFPTKLDASAIYWRKRGPLPTDVNPDRDRCGLHWICISLPFDGRDIGRVAHIAEAASFRNNLEPQIMFFAMNERLLKSFIVIAYDRDAEDEEKRANRCYRMIFDELLEAGYTPNRLGIQSMTYAAPNQTLYIDFVKHLKNLFDPNDILAPGRYDFRHCWQRIVGTTQ